MATETYQLNADAVVYGLSQFVYDEARRATGIDEQTACRCVRGLLDVLYLNFKGVLLYIPTGDGSERSDLYDKVYADFRGHNHAELAVKYRRSVQWVYNVVRARHRTAILKAQDDLFGGAEPEAERVPVLLQVMQEYLPAEWQRAGLEAEHAQRIAAKLIKYTVGRYPGIVITISEALHNKHTSRYLPGLL